MVHREMIRGSVADLLFDPTDGNAELCRQVESGLAPAGALQKFAFHVDPAGLLDQTIRAMLAMLSTPLQELIGWAWTTRRDIKNACGNTLAIAGTHDTVDLGTHSLESTQRPQVAIDINGLEQPWFELRLAISLTFDRATLHISEGAIQSVDLGHISSSVELTSGSWLNVSRTLHDVSVGEFDMSMLKKISRAKLNEIDLTRPAELEGALIRGGGPPGRASRARDPDSDPGR